MTDTGSQWLDRAGPEPEIVVSTRVRLARNIVSYPFIGRNSSADREAIARLVESAASDAPVLAQASWQQLDRLPRKQRLWLNEASQASWELAGLGPSDSVVSGAGVLASGDTIVMVNEEDHLRIVALEPGFAPGPAYAAAEAIDQALGERISFAFHPEFGYLAACPTNVGTGLRASVMIHLPALVLTREIGKVLEGLGQVGLTHRGLRGEGSEVQGGLFQLSNQTTLGKSEIELLDHLEQLVTEVIGHEIRARSVLLRDARLLVEDRIWRAWGLLRSARLLGYGELLNLLSAVRLGIGMGLLPAMPMTTLNRLMVESQDAHVARSAGIDLDDDELPAHRARLVRRLLEGGSG